MKIGAVLFTLIVSCWCSNALQCRSYGKQVGECVVISRCPPFLAIILSVEKTTEDIRMLQKLTCITASDPNKEPVVCCPVTEIVSSSYINNAQDAFSGSTTTAASSTTTSTPKPPGFNGASLFQEKFDENIPPLESCSQADVTGSRIIGGTDAEHGMYPWMARLGYRNLRTNHVEYYCGGVVINKRYVLTAAHCTHGYDDSFELKHVRLGEHNTQVLQDCSVELNSCSVPENFGVEKVITHPQYNTDNKHNDISIVRLDRDIAFNSYFIKPICLPFLKEYGIAPLERQAFDKLTGTVAGWGRTNWTKSEGSSILQHVRLPIVPTDKCVKDFRNRISITQKQLCAGGERNQDSCGGDSGGPLMADVVIKVKNGIAIKKSFQFGIVSFGPVKCGIGIPGVYTRVSEYLPWILKNLEP